MRAPAAHLLIGAATAALLLGSAGRASATDACPDGLDLQRVLAAHGADGLSTVLTLDFAFHVVRDGNEIIRTWHWDLRTNQVTLSTRADDGSALLLAFQSPPPAEASEDVHHADRQFINDRYWLLFPLQLGSETGATVTVACDPQPLPLGGDPLPRFTVVYGSQGGYTPGDAYDFWVRPDGLIEQWSYRRGNAPEAAMSVRFGPYSQVGPLILSLVRTGADGAARVWFSDVSATTTGGIFGVVPIPRD